MQPDPFVERLAQVRNRFASTLERKIDNACEALPQLSRNDAAAIALVADTYQAIHHINGVGATVGFVATGKAARSAEGILLPAYREKRALTADEADRFQAALQVLRSAAQTEVRSLDRSGS